MKAEINVLALVRGEHKYLFLFDDESLSALLRQFGRFASHPDLTFTWHDAAVLTRRAMAMRPPQPPV